MATETLSSSASENRLTGIDGKDIYEEAKNRVAAREATLAEVNEEIRQMADDLLNGKTEVEIGDTQKPLLDDKAFDDMELPEELVPEMFREQIEAEVEEAKSEAEELHQQDVSEAGRTDVHLTSEPEGVLGHSDGKKAVVDKDAGITKATVNHEFQHVEDGAFMASVDNLDAGLADGIEEDLPDAVAEKIDTEDEALTFSARGVLEERATETGGETPAQYQEEFVKPHDNVVNRMNRAGLDGESTMNRLVEQRDIEGYRAAIRQLMIREAYNPSLN